MNKFPFVFECKGKIFFSKKMRNVVEVAESEVEVALTQIYFYIFSNLYLKKPKIFLF